MSCSKTYIYVFVPLAVIVCFMGRPTDAQNALKLKVDYATYLGGNRPILGEINGIKMVRSIAFDKSDNVYLVGNTSSDDFPVSRTALQTRFGGGNGAAFVMKLLRVED